MDVPRYHVAKFAHELERLVEKDMVSGVLDAVRREGIWDEFAHIVHHALAAMRALLPIDERDGQREGSKLGFTKFGS